ncbi:MAG: hypothetical protein ACXWF2_13710 [Usitatibacter sp.]
MVMNTRQKVATALLALAIVASVMGMPGTNEAQRPLPPRAMGPLKATPVVAVELPAEHVRDLTYN